MTVLADMPTITFGAGERRFVYAIARRIVRTDEDAEDVAQEALLLAHRHRASFRGESAVQTWLYRIATTTALGHLRRAKRTRAQVALADADLDLADSAKPADQAIADAELSALVREEVAKLKPVYREVLLVRADVNEHETAERLGISVANVKVRAHRARNQLRAALEPLLGAWAEMAA
jgi:RNA polymerase sigma-70 factor (ECF subfamily)